MYEDPVTSRFVWHELITSDPKAAAVFYHKVVGWGTQHWDKDPSYTLLTMGDRPMAGARFMPKEAHAVGVRPHWLSYIDTPNIDNTVKQAVELGGKVIRMITDLPGVGRYAVVQDPQGALFGPFTPEHGSWDRKPVVGDFSWNELLTNDWEAAFEFYQKLFAWEKTAAMDMGPLGTYEMYGFEGTTLGGMFNKPKDMSGPPFWLPYILVPDTERSAAAVNKAGGTLMNGPMKVPEGSWIAQGMDPQGAMFAIQSLAKIPAKKTTKKTATKTAAKKSKPVAKAKPAAKKKVKAKPAPKKGGTKKR